jgi:hypothetical protein
MSAESNTFDAPLNEESAVCKVSRKLRTTVSALVGVAGYKSILARTLTLAVPDSEALRLVSITNDGLLQGIDNDDLDAGEFLIFHLLGLLVIFTGADFTLRLLQEAWPDLPEFDTSKLENQNGISNDFDNIS